MNRKHWNIVLIGIGIAVMVLFIFLYSQNLHQALHEQNIMKDAKALFVNKPPYDRVVNVSMKQIDGDWYMFYFTSIDDDTGETVMDAVRFNRETKTYRPKMWNGIIPKDLPHDELE